MTEWLDQALEEAVRRSWEAGSPITGSDHGRHSHIAAVARRRIQSFPRRGKKSNGRLARTDDLAKGLVAAMEHDPELVGALIEDYRWLAEQLVTAYDAAHQLDQAGGPTTQPLRLVDGPRSTRARHGL